MNGPDAPTPTNRTQLVAYTGIASMVAGAVGALYFLRTGRHLTPEQQQAVLELVIVAFAVSGALANLGSVMAKAAGQRAARIVDKKVDLLHAGAAVLNPVAAAQVQAEDAAAQESGK